MSKLKLPKIIGHRGAAAYAPENTLEGIHTAADMDVRWVELDVKITKDQVPVLFHDERLDRTTNGTGFIAEVTYEELRELEAGSWFSDSFAGIKIPTLEEALEVLIDRDLGLNLEIKACPGREAETAEVALDFLSHVWDDHERLLISSFSTVSMDVAIDMAEDWHRGLLLPEEWPDDWEELVARIMPSAININGNACSKHQIEVLKEIGKPILAYTINDPERARLLQSWGVDGFFSDAPDVTREGILTVH
jgi:glycerophosphoryl diester phosphodiesterase